MDPYITGALPDRRGGTEHELVQVRPLAAPWRRTQFPQCISYFLFAEGDAEAFGWCGAPEAFSGDRSDSRPLRGQAVPAAAALAGRALP